MAIGTVESAAACTGTGELQVPFFVDSEGNAGPFGCRETKLRPLGERRYNIGTPLPGCPGEIACARGGGDGPNRNQGLGMLTLTTTRTDAESPDQMLCAESPMSSRDRRPEYPSASAAATPTMGSNSSFSCRFPAGGGNRVRDKFSYLAELAPTHHAVSQGPGRVLRPTLFQEREMRGVLG